MRTKKDKGAFFRPNKNKKDINDDIIFNQENTVLNLIVYNELLESKMDVEKINPVINYFQDALDSDCDTAQCKL